MTKHADNLSTTPRPNLDEWLARRRAMADGVPSERISISELSALLDALASERVARAEADQRAALFGDQSDRFERLFLAERKRVEAVQRREREIRALLGQAGLLIKTLQERFGENSAGKVLLSRIRRLPEDK